MTTYGGSSTESSAGRVGTPEAPAQLVFNKPETGEPIHPEYLSKLFAREAKRLELPRLTFHGLRHTAATLGLSAGIPTKVMSDRLGHTSPAFTMAQYQHSTDKLQEDAAEKLAALVFSEPEPET